MPYIDTRVAAIFRHDRPIRPLQGSTIVKQDEVFFIAASRHIRAANDGVQRLEKALQAHHAVGRRQYRRRAGRASGKTIALN